MTPEELEFYGDWVIVDPDTEEERKEAETYLNLWKKFIVRKLKAVVVDEKVIYRPSLPPLAATLGIKIGIKKEEENGQTY